MLHHELMVENCTVSVNGDISKLTAFAKMCSDLANQFVVSAFISNFSGPTALDCKRLDNLLQLPLPSCFA